ncbi:hypothetical protein OEW28_10720 [Defluviimonas sp. WL0002]|uniref:Stress-induced protein n=1 Tax=Albidovulum marisflavi TaxID=2984159 RepID=A0ABT2ZDA6_9RHOB|nr:hypothetical protein [Defluviimonas sp. WL0002]MCV2869099.1 hypothetical protein [Defluviimonas sp. WL0002]
MSNPDKTPSRKGKEDNRDTTSLPGAKGSISGQGREGGRYARDIGSRDELKRATERPAGTTRIRKSDKTGGSQEES